MTDDGKLTPAEWEELTGQKPYTPDQAMMDELTDQVHRQRIILSDAERTRMHERFEIDRQVIAALADSLRKMGEALKIAGDNLVELLCKLPEDEEK